MAANQDFVRGEDQPELLLPPLGLQFSKDEITVREKQGLIRRDFHVDRVCIRVVRPAFRLFCIHIFMRVFSKHSIRNPFSFCAAVTSFCEPIAANWLAYE